MVKYSNSFLIYAVSLLVLMYFIFHIFHGARGLYAEKNLDIDIKSLEVQLADLQKTRTNLEWKIKNLGGGNGRVDADLLSEYMRNLGYVKSDEVLLLE